MEITHLMEYVGWMILTVLLLFPYELKLFERCDSFVIPFRSIVVLANLTIVNNYMPAY